jgi:radical SAM protein with 4Fe4S-binding SPASM domain
MEFLTVDAPQDCIHLLASMEQDRSEDLADARGLLESLQGGCSAGTRVANIDAQGNVFPCQFARSPDFLVGNIRERPFSQLWSDGFNHVLSRFRDKQARLGGRCWTCNYRDLCGGGCRIRAHAAEGDFFAEDPFCFLKKNDISLPK